MFTNAAERLHWPQLFCCTPIRSLLKFFGLFLLAICKLWTHFQFVWFCFVPTLSALSPHAHKLDRRNASLVFDEPILFFLRLCMRVSMFSPLNTVQFPYFAFLVQQRMLRSLNHFTGYCQSDFQFYWLTQSIYQFICVSSFYYRLTSVQMEVYRYQRWLFVRFPMMMAPFWSVKAQIHDCPIQHWKIR